MSSVEIDRLTLRLAAPGIDDGTRLARRVADGLAEWRPPPDLARTVERVRVNVTHGTTGAPDSLGELGDRIVAALIRELEEAS
jgi:hypothetical protein